MEILHDKEMQQKSKDIQKMVKNEDSLEVVVERIQALKIGFGYLNKIKKNGVG